MNSDSTRGSHYAQNVVRMAAERGGILVIDYKYGSTGGQAVVEQQEHEGEMDRQIYASITEAAEHTKTGKQMESQPIERGREVDRMPRDPTPEEIQQQAKAIRAEWSKEEEARRAGMIKRTWRPPTVHIGTMRPGAETGE